MKEIEEDKSNQNLIKKITLSSDIFRYISHIITSIFVGSLAGCAAMLFHFLLNHMQLYLSPGKFTRLLKIPNFLTFIVPVIGGLIIIMITLAFRDISKERGVFSVIKSMILNNGFIPFKVTLFHFFAPILSIGTGAPLGPEGPAAQMGSGIGSFVSQKFKFDRRDMKMYTAAGACGAISAVFNAPITGVFFGIEVILMNDLKNQALSALIISSVVADVISRAVLGNANVFNIPAYRPIHLMDYPLYLVLGVACGFISLSYFAIKKHSSILISERLKIKNKFLIILPLALIFGICTIKYPQLYGIGYETINEVINNSLQPDQAAILLLLRLVYLALFLAAGFYGGTFAPSIVIGILLGFSFASGLNTVFGLNIDTTVFSLVAMGGVLAGINAIPLTSIMLIFEITNDYKFILPLMLVSIISYLVTIYVNRGTIYTNKMLELGIDITKKGEVDLLGKIRVKDLMRKKIETVQFDMPFKKLSQIILASPTGDVIVINKKGELVGVVSLNDIRHAILSNELVDLLIANDLVSKVPVITEKESVSSALNKIKSYDIENAPVVKENNHTSVTGILVQRDITQAYDQLLEEWETDQFLVDYSKKKTRRIRV